MTEPEIRQRVVDTANSWVGAPKGSNTHHAIIDLYNTYKPLPRGARMSYTMDWCAATVSAVAVANGLTDIMPVECSCGELIKLYKALGRWVEDDAYVPHPGDLIFYSWSDDGKGDCTKAPNHVGIVTKMVGDTITVVEGNMGSPSRVGTRKIEVNARYIRGYGVPDYTAKADKVNDAEGGREGPLGDKLPAPNGNTDPWYAPARSWAKEMGLADGTRPEEPCTRAEVWEMLKRYHEAATAAEGGK